MFDNFPVPKILERFQEFYDIFGEDLFRSKAQICRNEEWVLARDSRIRKRKAWEILFSGMNLEQILETINRIWLDPNYELIVIRKRINRIVIGSR